MRLLAIATHQEEAKAGHLQETGASSIGFLSVDSVFPSSRFSPLMALSPTTLSPAQYLQIVSFNSFKELVIPLTNPYPGPQSILILDNCNIHHSEKVQALVEDEAMYKLIFLPPYSLDLNPIEQAFFSIKSYL